MIDPVSREGAVGVFVFYDAGVGLDGALVGVGVVGVGTFDVPAIMTFN